MDRRHVWMNGRLQPADVPHISAFDRGFQLGDGVFETLRAIGGRPAELEEHLARLRRSADGLAIPLGPDAELGASIGAGERDERESERARTFSRFASPLAERPSVDQRHVLSSSTRSQPRIALASSAAAAASQIYELPRFSGHSARSTTKWKRCGVTPVSSVSV